MPITVTHGSPGDEPRSMPIDSGGVGLTICTVRPEVARFVRATSGCATPSIASTHARRSSADDDCSAYSRAPCAGTMPKLKRGSSPCRSSRPRTICAPRTSADPLTAVPSPSLQASVPFVLSSNQRSL